MRLLTPYALVDSLRRHFSQFGEVGHCTVMRDANTGRSRGFAFLNFVDPKAVNTVMVREHYLDGKVVSVQSAHFAHTSSPDTFSLLVGGVD